MKMINPTLLFALFVSILFTPPCDLALAIPKREVRNTITFKNRIKIRKRGSWRYSNPSESIEFLNERSEMLNRKRAALISDIMKVIAITPHGPQKAELNLRLGRLHLEDYHSKITRAHQVHEKQLGEYQKNRKKTTQPNPVIQLHDAQISLGKAQEIFEHLQTKSPKEYFQDEVLFSLGIIYLDKGKSSRAMGYFSSLLERYPTSPYVKEALVHLGDHYFDRNEFTLAKSHYDKVISKHVPALAAYVLYKKAWCEYNMGRTNTALLHFKKAILAEDQLGKSASLKVKSEALRDIALPFVDLRLLDEAVSYFEQQGEPFFRQGLETMAVLNLEKGRYQSAIKLWETLLASNPKFSKNPDYEIQIAEALSLLNLKGDAISRLAKVIPQYLEDSDWYDANESHPTSIKNSLGHLEDTLKKHALIAHFTGQKANNLNLYAQAKLGHSAFLEFFPNSKDRAQIRFYLAEIQYKENQFVEASSNYYQVYQDPFGEKLKLEAIRFTLHSLDRQMNEERKKAGLAEINFRSNSKLVSREDNDMTFIPFSPIEQQFIDVVEEYKEKFPRQKDIPDMAYVESYLRYQHYDLEKASQDFRFIMQKFPRHQRATSAAYLTLDILNRKGEYQEMVKTCRLLLKNPAFAYKDFRIEVASILRHSELKLIQMIEEQGQFRLAADRYTEFARIYGKQDESLLEKGLYNAQVNYAKAEAFPEAVAAQERFIRRFPKSPMSEGVLLELAKNHELMGDLTNAAKWLEIFSFTYPKNRQSQNALRLAGLYYWGSGNIRYAETVMKTNMRIFPKAAPTIEGDLLDFYASKGFLSKQIAVYQQQKARPGTSKPKSLVLSLKIAELTSTRNGRIPRTLLAETLAFARANSARMKRNPESLEAYAKLLFWETLEHEKTFNQIRFTKSQGQIEKVFRKKLKNLMRLEKSYAQIASMGSVEWGIGSLFRIASLHQSLATSVDGAPLPKNLNAQETETYRAEISKSIVQPLNQKALKLAEECLERADTMPATSRWVSKCYTLAANLDPTRFPLIRTVYMPPLQTAVMLPKQGSKITVGNTDSFSYPYPSTPLFVHHYVDRSWGEESPFNAILYSQETKDISHKTGSPAALNYHALSVERHEMIRDQIRAFKPSYSDDSPSFAYLNVLRLESPAQAEQLILESIKKDPKNAALHNLLALTYMDQNQLDTARITWLSLLSRDEGTPTVLNNLGVLSYLEGKENNAIDYFLQSSRQSEPPLEVLSNLGFLALKNRSGIQAKGYFEKALQMKIENSLSQAGLFVAKIQSREFEDVKEGLVKLTQKYETDPYIHLSVTYFLADQARERELAGQILSDFMESQPLARGANFKQALDEMKAEPSVLE